MNLEHIKGLGWVIYLGASAAQVSWGGNDDPRGILVEGQKYEVEFQDVHSFHTKLGLVGLRGKMFNSVSFRPA